MAISSNIIGVKLLEAMGFPGTAKARRITIDCVVGEVARVYIEMYPDKPDIESFEAVLREYNFVEKPKE